VTAFLVAVVALAVILAVVYLFWTAGRLGRLHARVDAAAAALDAQLARRAGVARALAVSGGLPGPGAVELAERARAARDAVGLGADREAAENALSRALHAAFTVAGELDAPELDAAARKVVLARRFYNDAVRDTLDRRQRVIPRTLHLQGSAPAPAYFEIDDTALPAAAPGSPSAAPDHSADASHTP
jgi:hypothetical protein